MQRPSRDDYEVKAEILRWERIIDEAVFYFFVLKIVIYPVFTTVGYGEARVHVPFPQTTPIAVGEQLSVDIQIAGAQGVVGYELTVDFDPTALRYIGGANVDYLPEGAFALSPVVLNGAVHIAATSIIGVPSAREGPTCYAHL